jgi:hypothetical protein
MGSEMFSIEGVDYSVAPPSDEEMCEALLIRGKEYGLVRKKGLIFYTPQRGDVAICNLTHVETPMDPLEISRITMEGKDQVDRVLRFLREVFPDTFRNARIRLYGQTGIRQTRWLASVKQLTLDEIRSGVRFDDAVARTSWPVEIHENGTHIWETFSGDHVHYIPLRSMISPELDNYVAAGRCIDGDVGALSSVRVMGPCMATGDAAAKALFLAGKGSVHDIDIGRLQEMIAYNIEN